MAHKLLKKVFIKGEIIAQTGLMIGGASSAFEIGGVDKTIVRHPVTKMPYIPGSSLKGKMRSLLELHLGQIEDGGPTQNPDHEAAQIFGHIKSRNSDIKKGQRPSRIIVRDGYLKNADYFKNTDLLYTEIKAENSIDRITSEANPRFFERVPKGGRFELDLVLNVFEEEVNKNYFMYIMKALMLLQDDYLGAAGSRGNGQISIKIHEVKENSYNQDDLGSVDSNYLNMVPSAFKDK